MVRPITLEIDKELWEEFKAVTTKNKTLNDMLVCLIREYVKVRNEEENKKIEVENGGCINERTD